MKSLIFVISISFLLFSCGTDSNVGESKTTLEKGEHDLSSQGLPLIIKAPSEPLVEAEASGYDVKSSDVFQLIVTEGGDIEQKKADIQSDEVNKLQQFIVDEPNALFYETKITEPEYHFYVVLKDNNSSFELQENKTKQFSKEEVKEMFEAAKAARIAEKK